MASPEFVRIDGQTVRVTSLKQHDSNGTLDLVIVARGSTAAAFLAELGEKSRINMEIPEASTLDYSVVDADLRSTGEGEQSMNRARFTLAPIADPPTTGNATESQLDRIERKLDDILAVFNR
ncbi:MAG: hypothetical protein WKF81_09155 [Thermomicrobiales bacterium]